MRQRGNQGRLIEPPGRPRRRTRTRYRHPHRGLGLGADWSQAAGRLIRRRRATQQCAWPDPAPMAAITAIAAEHTFMPIQGASQ
jgi:hypothetical protein